MTCNKPLTWRIQRPTNDSSLNWLIPGFLSCQTSFDFLHWCSGRSGESLSLSLSPSLPLSLSLALSSSFSFYDTQSHLPSSPIILPRFLLPRLPRHHMQHRNFGDHHSQCTHVISADHFRRYMTDRPATAVHKIGWPIAKGLCRTFCQTRLRLRHLDRFSHPTAVP